MFLGGAIIVGVVAAYFAVICENAVGIFNKILAISNLLPLIIMPLGFMLSVFLTRRYFQGAQGSGIPQVIAVRELRDPELRKKLVSPRIAIGKIILTVFALMIGASTGREGPTVQIGAAIMLATGAFFGRKRTHGLVLAGGAAGIAAAFNTPLAGIVFAIEELSRAFERKASNLILTAIVFAGVSSIAISGNYTYFGTSSASITSHDWFAVAVCGIGGGLLGGLFSRFVIAGLTFNLPIANNIMKNYPIITAGICGLLVAVIGYSSGNIIYGTGYQNTRLLLEQNGNAPWYFGILKMCATALTSVSGIPGGFFAPSLAVGAGFGSNLSTIFPDMQISALALLGMVAYFAGVVQAPITAFVIVFEMTNNHSMVVPIIAASLIASSISRLVCPKPIYHTLAEAFLKRINPS